MAKKVATIGFFDGVHSGHRWLIRQVKEVAAERCMQSLIVTFSNHPRRVVHPEFVPSLLTTVDEKVPLLQAEGVDEVKVLEFTPEMSLMSARDFMTFLRDELDVSVLVMGYDHRFGHNGGTMDEYEAWSREVGMELIRADVLPETKVSSSVCRALLNEGRVEEACQLLGHPYTLQGRVVRGHQVGQKLGFPTANLQTDIHKLVPRRGVYAVWVLLDDGSRYKGMLNIGERPTIDDEEKITIEVNLLDFTGDLYGEQVTLSFVSFLRSEQKFDSRGELVNQIKRDLVTVKSIL